MKRRDYAALSICTFMNAAGANMQLGIWPFYLQLNKVGDELYGAFSTASSLFGILARVLSARLGSVSESLPFAAGVAASTGMMLVYALLPSRYGIAVGMSLSAISFALVIVGRTTLVGREAEGKSLAMTYAILITLANIGVIVGTNLGTRTFALSSYRTVFLAGAFVCFIGLVTALIRLPRAPVPSQSGFGVLKLSGIPSDLRRFFFATCLDSFSWGIAMPFFSITPARIFKVTQNDIALIQSLIFGSSMATNIVFATLSDRLWGRKFLLATSEVLGVIMFALYLLAPNVQPIFICALLMGLVISSWGPVVSAYISETSSAKQLNDNVGTWMTLTALVSIPAPIIGGFLAEMWFPRAPYLVSLVLVIGTAVYILKYLKEPRRPGVTLNRAQDELS